MKKILLLGGSAQQIVAIETAKRLGYYTILCDYLTDNPGQYYADKFYLVSTTDKEAVLKVAKDECVDGVLAYASDPAAPTAAYVAEKLNLSGNPYESVEILCNKDRFREFLRNNGFCAPASKAYDSIVEALDSVGKYSLPVLVKPVDSSGSKGITVVNDFKELENAIEFAFSFSRINRIVIEEFIEKDHKYLIGGDVFINNGKVVLWGLLNCHRDNNVNPLVPVGKSYPIELSEEYLDKVKNTIQGIVSKLKLNACGMNVELVVNSSGLVYPIDMGPRNGGNLIPDLLGMIFGVDIVEWSIKAAIGEVFDDVVKDGSGYWATYNLHADRIGAFDGVNYSKDIKPYLYRAFVYKEIGDKIEYFDNASKVIGIVFLNFDTYESMDLFMGDISKHIKILYK